MESNFRRPSGSMPDMTPRRDTDESCIYSFSIKQPIFLELSESLRNIQMKYGSSDEIRLVCDKITAAAEP